MEGLNVLVVLADAASEEEMDENVEEADDAEDEL
jgi:hypothetical protein